MLFCYGRKKSALLDTQDGLVNLNPEVYKKIDNLIIAYLPDIKKGSCWKMEKIKVSSYIRVGNKEQVRELVEQQNKLARYAEINGYEIIKTYKDLGYSAMDKDRPGLQELKKDVSSGLVDNVLIYTIDRITRSNNEFIELLNLFDNKGTNLISARDDLNTSNAMGRLSVEILRSFGEVLK